MRKLAIVLFAILVFGGVALAAERPQCQWDSQGNPILTQGVCFAEIEGNQQAGMFSPNGDALFAVFTGKQDWFRLGSNGSGLVHIVDQPAKLVYCSPSIMAIDHCRPEFDSELYIGTGKVSFNLSLTNYCPCTVSFVGDVTSPAGERFNIQGAEVDVKDKTSSWGCRTILLDISLKAK